VQANYIIREAGIADVPGLNKLVNSAYRGESSKQGWTTEADLLDGIRTNEKGLTEMIIRRDAVILLAEEATELQGCVFLEQQDDALYLGMLTVKPGLQGKGIGKLLMEAAEERARAIGCSKIKMTVITVRKELIAYYERKGYSDTGERKPFPNDPEFGIQNQPLEFMVMKKRVVFK
jgi:ribosomal protein S18 acetylase RimI-like enzyme